MEVSMQHWRSSNSAENQSNIVQRVVHSLKLMLLSGFFRLAGWGVVVGLPAMVLTPRRVAGLVRAYPIAATTICLAFLIGVAIWNEGNRPRPAEFEIESIENLGEPNELIAISSPKLPDSGSSWANSIAAPLDHTAAIETQHPAPRTPESRLRVEQTAPHKSQADTQSTNQTQIVWLTGHIEDVATSEPATPIRNAIRFPSNRR
jgi:hypothetical protein